MSDENPTPNRYPLGEPSVLDYVKSLLRFGDGERIHIPSVEEEPSAVSFQRSAVVAPAAEPEREVAADLETFQPSNLPTHFPWRSLLALFLALVGQRLFEPPPTTAPLGYGFYIGALILLVWAIRRGEWTLPPLARSSEGTDPQTYRLLPFIASILLGFWAFLSFGGNLFTTGNVVLWFFAVFTFIWAFWLPGRGRPGWFEKLSSSLQRGGMDDPFLDPSAHRRHGPGVSLPFL